MTLQRQGKRKSSGVRYTDIPISVVPKQLKGKDYGIIYVFVEGNPEKQKKIAKALLPQIRSIVRTIHKLQK